MIKQLLKILIFHVLQVDFQLFKSDLDSLCIENNIKREISNKKGDKKFFAPGGIRTSSSNFLPDRKGEFSRLNFAI